ncbi:hypothetical protein Aduo_007863 [Ancylostoma duodenale]
MSFSDPEEYYNYDKIVLRGARTGKGGGNIRKKVTSSNSFVTKTLYDPDSTLSKREQRRLLADRSDGFCPEVPYSLNKHERRNNVNGVSLLNNQKPGSPERLIINRSDVPCSASSGADTINSVNVIDDHTIVTVSAGGRRKPLKYFNGQLRERRNLDKEEPEPARLHFSITTPTTSTACSTKKSKQTNRRGVLIDKEDYSNSEKTDDSEEIVEEDSDCESVENSRKITLGDFLTTVGAFPPTQKPRTDSRAREDTCTKKQLPTMPASLVDISEATNAPHIFEIFEITTPKMSKDDFKQEILATVPKFHQITWFGPSRVSVTSRLLEKPMFVMFFEEEKSRRKMRIRISTDSQYTPDATKERLLYLIRTRRAKGFDRLYECLEEFIWKTEKIDREGFGKESRCAVYSEGFVAEVNSRMIAPLTVKCSEQDQIDFLNQFYTQEECHHEECGEVENSTKCSSCRLTNKNDLFLSHDGMMCRECVASFITAQLRKKQFPLEIPIVAAPGTSPFELLYAILPMAVVSLLLEKSFAFFKCLDFPYMVFVRCPHCLAPLAVTEKSDFNCCTCAVCRCSWCYLCNCELHWPMSCEQFKRWSDRWDTQYLFDKYHLETGEEKLRLCCDCDSVFHVEKDSKTSKTPLRCPRPGCSWNYEEDGTYRHWHGYNPPLSSRMRKHIIALGSEIEYCDECKGRITRTLPQKRLIKKDFAILCAEARIQRFNARKREEFDKNVARSFQLKAEQYRANDLRKTVLLLVENCTAWIYLNMPSDWQHLRAAVSQLFRQLLAMDWQTSAERVDTASKVDQLEKATSELISVFQGYINKI